MPRAAAADPIELELFRHRGVAPNYHDGLFALPSWISVLLGQGVLPGGYDRMVDNVQLPQAARVVIPPTTSMFASLLMDSSLLSVIGVMDLMRLLRVGASETVPVDFRLIGATNVDLAAEVAAGRFREDLYYRLNVFPIRVPPLRERRDDIPLLAAAFRARFARENGVNPPEIPRQVLAAMSEYAWPGNVRELENYIERTMILSSGSEAMEFTPVGPAEHPERRLLARAGPERWALGRLEREYVLEVLHRTKGHQGKAIRILGISRRTLYRKLRRWQREGHVALPLEGEVVF